MGMATGINLTSLLLAATRSRTHPCKDLASINSIDLAAKIRAGHYSGAPAATDGDEEAARISDIQRQSPLLAKVDRSTYSFTPAVIDTITPAPTDVSGVKSSARKQQPSSPLDADVDRPRDAGRRDQGHHLEETSQRSKQRGLPVASPAPHTNGRRKNRFGREPEATGEHLESSVGEAWSEDRQTGDQAQRVPRKRSGSLGCSPHVSREHRRCESHRSSSVPRGSAWGKRLAHAGSVHDFLYHESSNREERLRAKQKERDRELTFQPNLAATTRYYKTGCRRRWSDREAGGAPTHSPDGHGNTGEARGGNDNATRGTVRGLQRFEMLYEDSKAQRLRVHVDSLRVPAACTFQPKLVASRPTSRERKWSSETARSRQKTGETERRPVENGSHGVKVDGHGKTHALPSSSNPHRHVGEAYRERGAEREGESEEFYSQSSHEISSSVESRGERPLSYAERLYRGGDEQRQLWAKRWEEQARLELEGCTFRPRLREARLAKYKGDRQSPGHSGYETENRRAGRQEEGPVHERLYRQAEEDRLRRKERINKTKRAETDGCTFHPSVRGLAAPRSTSPKKASRTSPATATAITAAAAVGDGTSVYERLMEAGREMRRRKIRRGQATPPGCTFKPNVNTSRPKGDSQGWVRPPPPPPTRHEDSPVLPPDPLSTAKTNDAASSDDVDLLGGATEASGGGFIESKAVGVDELDNLDVTSIRQPVQSKAVVAPRGTADIINKTEDADNGESSKLQCAYMDTNCFSPRRRRGRGNSNNSGGDTAGTVSPKHPPSKRGPNDCLEKTVVDRLHQLGDALQRRRNMSPRDPSTVQRKRQEDKELLECTFLPTSFTRTYHHGKTIDSTKGSRSKRVSRTSVH